MTGKLLTSGALASYIARCSLVVFDSALSRIQTYSAALPEDVNPVINGLLTQLLDADYTRRITASNILRHPWLQPQLILCSDMKGIRSNIPYLTSDIPSDDIDDGVLNELDQFGILREEVIQLILTKLHSSWTTLYYLLLDVIVKRRKLQGIATRDIKQVLSCSKPSQINSKPTPISSSQRSAIPVPISKPISLTSFNTSYLHSSRSNLARPKSSSDIRWGNSSNCNAPQGGNASINNVWPPTNTSRGYIQRRLSAYSTGRRL